MVNRPGIQKLFTRAAGDGPRASRFWLFLLMPLLLVCGGCASGIGWAADGMAPAMAAMPEARFADDGFAHESANAPNATFAESRKRYFDAKESQSEGADTIEAGGAPDRLIIYTAGLRVRVSNLESAKKKYVALVASVGGYLQSQEDQTLTCRVPAGSFDDAVGQIRDYGIVLKESINAQDITREFLDLEIRLDNAVKSRERLLELLQKADKVADLLAVEKELKRLTEEIERFKGQLRYFRDQVAFSTISVTFNGPPSANRPQERVYSRFSWINQIGVDYVLQQF